MDHLPVSLDQAAEELMVTDGAGDLKQVAFYGNVGGIINGTNYGILSNGVKSTVVKMNNGDERINVLPRSPGGFVPDYGTGKLQKGFAVSPSISY